MIEEDVSSDGDGTGESDMPRVHMVDGLAGHTHSPTMIPKHILENM